MVELWFLKNIQAEQLIFFRNKWPAVQNQLTVKEYCCTVGNWFTLVNLCSYLFNMLSDLPYTRSHAFLNIFKGWLLLQELPMLIPQLGTTWSIRIKILSLYFIYATIHWCIENNICGYSTAEVSNRGRAHPNSSSAKKSRDMSHHITWRGEFDTCVLLRFSATTLERIIGINNNKIAIMMIKFFWTDSFAEMEHARVF